MKKVTFKNFYIPARKLHGEIYSLVSHEVDGAETSKVHLFDDKKMAEMDAREATKRLGVEYKVYKCDVRVYDHE
jgi:hypothetical protein